MTTLTALQEAMTAYLTAQGLRALSAWPQAGRQVEETPLAVVAVQAVEGTPAGLGDCLGFSPQGQEFPGQRLRVRFAIDLYSPWKQGEEGCRALLDRVVQAAGRQGPGGLAVEKWTMGETAFREEAGMFYGRLCLECQGLLLEEETESEAFLGFEVKGGVTIDRDHEA